MNECKKWCYFHPTEMVIGICALCLNERLSILAAKYSKKSPLHKTHTSSSLTPYKKAAPIVFTKLFTLTSLLNLLEIKQQKPAHDHHTSSTSSPQDSFISIKIEDNGVASWEKAKTRRDGQCDMSLNWSKAKKIKSLVEHAKPRLAMLRWRKRISHLFRLIRLKRSNKGNVCHVGTKSRMSKG